MHEEPVIVDDVQCPQCQIGQLVERTSKYGKTFYGCNQYPKCDFVLNFKPVAGTCQSCGFNLLAEKPGANGVKLICASRKCQTVQQP